MRGRGPASSASRAAPHGTAPIVPRRAGRNVGARVRIAMRHRIGIASTSHRHRIDIASASHRHRMPSRAVAMACAGMVDMPASMARRTSCRMRKRSHTMRA
ncbi:hypothetical protein EZV77_31525 [Burkholderia thailandensis]|uniref:Uncharacterized protein n=1 Tax=Burkholderia thailandensis TaxID=57975 RepID=A0AAW9CRP0_BURTH|nr:hypothetical protein [Burkholderia thailandensis]MDW9252516.1 hypothetical protein [Burkholderia thailandensis]PJO73646.1 hypothetical protein CWD92_03020 [Burkholderia thailandensis]TBW55005.1 hypothetical protein EZV77_31525 [Burkholderia thailandensis]